MKDKIKESQIEKIRNHYKGHFDVQFLISEIDRLKEENERLKNGGWISVKERLPEEDDWYLVFIQTPTEKFVTTERIRGSNANPPDCITHWMPLPEPPEVTPND